MQPLDHEALARIKRSFVTRRLDLADVAALDPAPRNLEPGDLVIARVEQLGHHTKIEHPNGRRAALHPGDTVLLACGARYAPDQFEADCPSAAGPADLAAAGGIAGLVRHQHDRIAQPTRIEILGVLQDRAGCRINLKRYAIDGETRPICIPMLAVCGTAMNSGKTYTVASLVRGYSNIGYRAAAIKVTGTGAGGDLWAYTDAGAHIALDFTDAGFSTTYRVPVSDILAGLWQLASATVSAGADVIVLELADGLQQQETAALLNTTRFLRSLTGVVFAACDALGAKAGVSWLEMAGAPVCAVSGAIARSPLAMREAAEIVGVPCLTASGLQATDALAKFATLQNEAPASDAA